MFEIINLTPHPITIRTQNGEDKTYPKSGLQARVEQVQGEEVSDPDLPVPFYTIPKTGAVYIEDENGNRSKFPKKRPGVVLIVSRMVLNEIKRNDVFGPGTGPNDGAIRDDRGRIVAVTRLIRSTPSTELVTRSRTHLESLGWKEFKFFSSYYGSLGDGSDKNVIYLFHPSVDFTQWADCSFYHGKYGESEEYDAFNAWLEDLDEDLYEVFF